MRAWAMTIATLLAAAPAPAQINPREADPAIWLRRIYDLYHRAEKNDALLPQSGVELVEQRASRAFGALLKRDEDCVKKSGRIYALDWDFFIDGQAWEISEVKVGATRVEGTRATVTVSFVNMKKPCVNVFSFVRENGVWKVDDIETRPKGEKPTRVAAMLRDFKDY